MELRDANEAWEHSALLGESDAERVQVGERLSDAVSELEGWLDTRGPKALQSPHQGPDGWGWVDGATRFVQLEKPWRARLRRFAKPCARQPAHGSLAAGRVFHPWSAERPWMRSYARMAYQSSAISPVVLSPRPVSCSIFRIR